jgi:hypothetical protein
VRRSFEEAIRTNVTNVRATKNLTLYEQALKVGIKNDKLWERATEILMRNQARDIFHPAFVDAT